MTAQPLLSLIVPAYNEAQRLPNTLPKIVTFIQAQPYQTELLIINNNSSDQTETIAAQFATQYPFIHLINEPRQGKGAAVKTGMLQAKGKYRFIADADLSMPIDEVNKFLPPNLTEYDVAIGSREAPGAVRYNEPEYRHLMGRIFNLIVKILAIPKLQDTQCGFKCFRDDVANQIFQQQTIDGWAFDVEILFIALQHQYSIKEVPINWYYQENSRINPIRDSLNMVAEVLKIRWNGLRGHYK